LIALKVIIAKLEVQYLRTQLKGARFRYAMLVITVHLGRRIKCCAPRAHIILKEGKRNADHVLKDFNVKILE
jgi:hypothetical protein